MVTISTRTSDRLLLVLILPLALSLRGAPFQHEAAVFDSAPEPVAACRSPWGQPVEAPIVDPYRPPSSPFGPGNRGYEYGTEAGQPVFAVADGVVRFAGPVAGAPVVVVDHGAELWSTYTSLTRRLVSRGESVGDGQRIAHADVGFHLTARQNRRYLDPGRLLSRSCDVVRLVASGRS
jgi:murein DD-endopeptidase MepM/ murein hydrolase activator NlpD